MSPVRKIVSLAVAALLAVLVVGLIVSSVQSSGDPAGQQDASSAGSGSRSDCLVVNIASSSEKAALLTELADAYNKTGPESAGKCVSIAVQTKASGLAERRLAEGWDEAADGPLPTAWTPASSLWVKLLETRLSEGGKPPLSGGVAKSIVKTPVVFAIPRPMALALGWPSKPIGWETLATLATDPRGWAAYGHPEWGKFTIGKTHPELSTSGLAGTLGEFYAATGLTSDLKVSDVKSDAARDAVSAIESAVTHYGDTTLTFLANQLKYDETFTVPYVSAVVVEEKSVVDYNAGNPTGKVGAGGKPPVTPLVAVQPAEGTLYSDNPFVVLDSAPWVSPAQAKAAGGFLAFLDLPENVEVLTTAGFRSVDGQLGGTVRNDPNLTAAPPEVVLPVPSGEVLAAVQSTWKDLRKKARIMLVLDVSGSMEENAGDGQSKLEKATVAIRESLVEFNGSDEVGLGVFTSDLPGGKDGIYQVLVPPGPMSANRARIEQALRLSPLNGTPLYDTIVLAQDDARASFDPSRINAIVVLTDGRDSAEGKLGLPGLLDRIRLTSENRASNVKVFTIGYGADADMSVLNDISGATGASAYDATNPANIGRVLTSVMSNF